MITLTKENIDYNVDYDDLGSIESSFMHDKNRLGEKGVVEKYRNLLDTIKFGSDTSYNFLACIINHFSIKNNLSERVALRESKLFVLDPSDFFFLDVCETEKEKEDVFKKINYKVNLADLVFLEAKIIVYELGEAV